VPLSDTVLENIRSGVIAIDHGGLVAVYNVAAEEMLAYPATACFGAVSRAWPRVTNR